jgi:hypothetical protein
MNDGSIKIYFNKFRNEVVDVVKSAVEADYSPAPS